MEKLSFAECVEKGLCPVCWWRGKASKLVSIQSKQMTVVIAACEDDSGYEVIEKWRVMCPSCGRDYGGNKSHAFFKWRKLWTK